MDILAQSSGALFVLIGIIVGYALSSASSANEKKQNHSEDK